MRRDARLIRPSEFELKAKGVNYKVLDYTNGAVDKNEVMKGLSDNSPVIHFDNREFKHLFYDFKLCETETGQDVMCESINISLDFKTCEIALYI